MNGTRFGLRRQRRFFVRIYKNQTVYDATIARLNWIYDEFPNVVVSVSGGKDSTVVFEMTLEVARERGRLPLNVMWIDQEGEWESTVEQNRYMMYHPDVKPYWMQIPMVLFNATSVHGHWLRCWDPTQQDLWIHEQDPISYKENIYGTDRFAALFGAIIMKEFRGIPTACLGGVRAEESPTRVVSLTYAAKYKWVTWGKQYSVKERQYGFYPIYDWSYTDVWKAIHDHQWRYNTLYDMHYRMGTPIHAMRVSNVHHETALHALFFMQEVEPVTYARLAARLDGIDTAAKLGGADYYVHEVPFMFTGWREYRDYLLIHLIDNPEWQLRMRKTFEQHDADLGDALGDAGLRVHVQSILAHDWEGIKSKAYYIKARMRAKEMRTGAFSPASI